MTPLERERETPEQHAKRALNEWFGEGHWPPVHKLDALIASVSAEAEARGRAAGLEPTPERVQLLARIICCPNGICRYDEVTQRGFKTHACGAETSIEAAEAVICASYSPIRRPL